MKNRAKITALDPSLTERAMWPPRLAGKNGELLADYFSRRLDKTMANATEAATAVATTSIGRKIGGAEF